MKIVINNFEWLCNPNELKKQIVVLCGHWGKSGWTIPYSIKKNGVDLVHPTYKDKKYLRMEKYFSNNSTAIDDEEQSMIDRIFVK